MHWFITAQLERGSSLLACGEFAVRGVKWNCAPLTPRRRKGKLCFVIVSVGVDMIEVQRIRQALEDPKIGRRFRSRVYTDKEIRYCEQKGRGKYLSYAGRFAAKEAIMKALGKGWGSKVSWDDIEVLPASGGKPEVYLRHKTSALARELRIDSFFLSITHTQDYAMAYVIAQRK